MRTCWAPADAAEAAPEASEAASAKPNGEDKARGAAGTEASDARGESLAKQVAELQAEVAELKAQFAMFRKQFE